MLSGARVNSVMSIATASRTCSNKYHTNVLSVFYHFWALWQNNYDEARQKNAPSKLKSLTEFACAARVTFWVYVRKTQTQKRCPPCSGFFPMRTGAEMSLVSGWWDAQSLSSRCTEPARRAVITPRSRQTTRVGAGRGRCASACLASSTIQAAVWNGDIYPGDFWRL